MGIAANRALARSERKRLGSEFDGAATSLIGKELSDLIVLGGKMTSKNRDANKYLESGLEELGIAPEKESFFEKTSNLLKNPTTLFDSIRKPQDKSYESDGREYNTNEVQAIGRMKNSTDPLVHSSLAGKKLSSMVGRKLSPTDSAKDNDYISNLAPKVVSDEKLTSPFGSKTGFGANRTKFNLNTQSFSPIEKNSLSSQLMGTKLKPDTTSMSSYPEDSPEILKDMSMEDLEKTSTIKEPSNQGFKHHYKDEDNFFGNGITGMGNGYND